MDELNLIDALRQWQRLSGNSNPFTPQNPDMPQQVPQLMPQAVPANVGQNDTDYSNELMQRYMQQLNNMPVREAPSLKQKIFAGLSGMAGDEKTAENTLYGKYNRQLADWKLKTEELGKGATQERGYNINKRQTQAMENLNTFRQGELDAKNRQLTNAESRTAIYKYKAENPAGVIKSDSEGNLIKINPLSGETTYLFNEDTGEPIKGANLPDSEKLSIQQANAMEIQSARASAAQELERIKEVNRVKNIGLQGEQNRETKAVVPGGTAATVNKPESPAAKATRWRNNANKFKAEHPDLAKHVTVEGNNVSIAQPKGTGVFSKFSSAPTQEEYDLMKKSIFDIENNEPTSDNLESPGKQEAIPEEPKITAKDTTTPVARKSPNPNKLATVKAHKESGQIIIAKNDGTDVALITPEQWKNYKGTDYYEVK